MSRPFSCSIILPTLQIHMYKHFYDFCTLITENLLADQGLAPQTGMPYLSAVQVSQTSVRPLLARPGPSLAAPSTHSVPPEPKSTGLV